MANAYDVMSMAKRQGAEVKAVENYDKYMDAIKAEEARASKAGMFGKIGGGIGGSIASYLAPAAIAALGVGTGGIGSMLLSGALGAGISRGGTEIGDFLARQWKMGGKGRGKDFKAPSAMKGISGAYGQKRMSELMRGGKQSMETQRDTIAQMLDVENTNRWLSSAMSGLGTAGKARAGFEKAGLADKSMKEVWKSGNMGDRMKFAMGGGVGEGYKLGAKSTGDWWSKPEFADISKMSPSSPMSLQTGFGAKTTPLQQGYDYFETGTSPLVKDRSLGEMLVSSGFSPEGTAKLSGMGTGEFAPLSIAEVSMASGTPEMMPMGQSYEQQLYSLLAPPSTYDANTGQYIQGSGTQFPDWLSKLLQGGR